MQYFGTRTDTFKMGIFRCDPIITNHTCTSIGNHDFGNLRRGTMTCTISIEWETRGVDLNNVSLNM
jgi:hypothetical protein